MAMSFYKVNARLQREIDFAPFWSRVAAQASVDAPVVITSSTKRICLFKIADYVNLKANNNYTDTSLLESIL